MRVTSDGHWYHAPPRPRLAQALLGLLRPYKAKAPMRMSSTIASALILASYFSRKIEPSLLFLRHTGEAKTLLKSQSRFCAFALMADKPTIKSSKRHVVLIKPRKRETL
jgi:hypothetical protein